MTIDWACPKCGAKVGVCGVGGVCRDGCMGFVCDCTDDVEHGDSLSNPCPHAACYHCEWGGVFPVRPKRLAPWEKKALAAGWEPPKGWQTNKEAL